MASIYDKKRNVRILDTGSVTVSDNEKETTEHSLAHQPLMEAKSDYTLDNSTKYKETVPEVNDMEIQTYQERAFNAMNLVDDIVLKNYLTQLSQMDIVPCENPTCGDVILFKINKMVYEKDEYATDKFISVVSAMTYTDCSIFMIVDGNITHTDFYLGIKCNDAEHSHSTIAETFRSSLLGQFPGALVEDLSIVEAGKDKAIQEHLLNRITDNAESISSCVGVPSYKNSKGEYTNANFIQGIEKFALAMQGKKYTAIILTANT